MAAKAKSKATKPETSKNTKYLDTLKHDEDKSSLAFKILSSVKTVKALEAGDVDQLEVLVSEVLELQDTAYSLNEYIRLDYFVSGLWWCREQNYSTEQTSAFLTIMESLLNNIQKQVSLVDNVLELRRILTKTSMDGSDSTGIGSTSLFNTDQARDIIDYFYTSLFQHYKLYDCFFQNPPQDFVIGIDMELETAKPAHLPWPAPLGEAVPDEIMKLFLQDNTDQEVSQVVGEAGEKQKSAAQMEEDAKLEESLLAQMSPEQIKKIMKSVYSEMLAGVEEEIAVKIREKENVLISKINQLHIIDRT